jgi:hypothetical protein
VGAPNLHQVTTLLFSVSVADKELSVCVSGLESTDTGMSVSVDSKGVCRLGGG